MSLLMTGSGVRIALGRPLSRNNVQQYFSFKNTATRSEYWAVQIIGFVAFASAIIMGIGFTLAQLYFITAVVYLAAIVGYVWLLVATSVRRCRDADISPWWTLATIVPYVGFVVWIVIGCLGTETKYEEGTPKFQPGA
jgi:uncharacterized membrane protein YhaH (DUF805 family)